MALSGPIITSPHVLCVNHRKKTPVMQAYCSSNKMQYNLFSF